ncbi:DUF3576 domain-containing protein [Candidatus Pelagibacter sp.]|jgi:hypothetical protein|nr:DUF3576 domain-containing protein [Candidatus Pelagibacter sp.]
MKLTINIIMFSQKKSKVAFFIFLISTLLNSCASLPGSDARKNPADPKERVKQNIEQGKGFRLMDKIGKGGNGTFEFASSNELWRASLDTIDFMPLASVNYSGGIIITDWYSTDSSDESIKVSIRFLTNEIRSDALEIKVFKRKCTTQNNCIVSEQSGNLTTELTRKILKTAKIYEKQKKDKNFKPYKASPTN